MSEAVWVSTKDRLFFGNNSFPKPRNLSDQGTYVFHDPLSSFRPVACYRIYKTIKVKEEYTMPSHKVPSRELIILLVEVVTFPETYGISGRVTLRAETPLLSL